MGVSQLKLIFTYYNLEHCSTIENMNQLFTTSTTEEPHQGRQLLKPEFILSMKNRLQRLFDKWLSGEFVCVCKFFYISNSVYVKFTNNERIHCAF